MRVTLLLVVLWQASLTSAQLPSEPLDIGYEPQFLFDGYVVDNHWAIRYKRQAMRRVFHQAKKHGEPVMRGDQPSFLWVVRDEKAGLFRMYYQANFRSDVADFGERAKVHNSDCVCRVEGRRRVDSAGPGAV